MIDHIDGFQEALEMSLDVRMPSTCLILSNIMMAPSLHPLKHKTPCHEVLHMKGVPNKAR